jgi:hypothetical protein
MVQELGISADSVYRAYWKEEIPAAQFNRMIRFDLEMVQRAMDRRRTRLHQALSYRSSKEFTKLAGEPSSRRLLFRGHFNLTPFLETGGITE